MTPRPIIIDCDPGQDDAVALLMALAVPDKLTILGITTVAGNVTLDLTEKNARKICELAGRTDVPVFAGCPRPLIRPLRDAASIHGASGMDGADLPEPITPKNTMHAVDFIVDTILTSPEPITLVPTAPLTNIACAIVKEPRILKNIKEIVLMGGARDFGNITPAAEFNFYVDPHAAHIVFTSGAKITMLGLDVTHQALASPSWINHLKQKGGRINEVVAGVLDIHVRYDIERYKTTGGPVHDPCVIAYLLRPELFSGKEAYVHIEIQSEHSIGRSIVDWWGQTNQPTNAYVIDTINSVGFFNLIEELLDNYSSSSSLIMLSFPGFSSHSSSES